MINLTKRSFLVALACGAVVLATSSAFAAKVKTEDELIADLASPKESVVTGAMLKLEKEHPTSTKWQPEVKKMLTDSRSAVRRKAGRVLGSVHAEVSEADLKNITAMFSATDPQEAMDALKSLRGLALKTPCSMGERVRCAGWAKAGRLIFAIRCSRNASCIAWT